MVLHVLLAESASTAGAMLRQTLRQLGYRVQIVPEDALSSIRESRCQAEVILVGSFDACRASKLQRQLAALPVVLYDPVDRPLGFRFEPESFLAGPFLPAKVQAAVEEALAVKASRLREGILAELNVWLPSDSAELEALNKSLPAWLAGCGLTPFQVQQTNLAVREVVANAIEWGHGYERSRLVRVECKLDDEKVTILVRDTGAGFDRGNLPHAARPGDPLTHLRVRAERQIREGGFGILIASGLVDHLCYSDSGNEGLIIKYLPTPAYVEAPALDPLTTSLAQ